MNGLGLFNRASGSKAYKTLQKQKYNERSASRDVHTSQNMDRGTVGEVSKPTKERVLSVIIALFFAVLGFIVGYLMMIVMAVFEMFSNYEGGTSWLDMDMSAFSGVTVGWQLWAWTGLVFLVAYGATSQKMMGAWRSKNSMVDATDINSYENDQHIMLPEEIRHNYDIFPDVGASSSVEVSSMLSHNMISRKGLKQVDVAERYAKDQVLPDGTKVLKGEVVKDEDGNTVFTKMPIIDEEFGQELFTASGIPVDAKDIRTPIDVRKLDYNKIDESGSRRDRDKLEYDTIADVINNDWEFKEHEVQRPAGFYMVDTAPVNTMVLAITRAGKGKLARLVQ